MREKYLNKLVDILKKEKIDAILIAPSEEMEFIMGHNTHLCERFQALIIKNDGSYFYICNLLTQDEIQSVLGPDIKVYGWFDGDKFTDTVNKAFQEQGLIGKTVAVNSTERAFIILQIMEAMDVKFINGKPFLEDMRIIKDEEELENLRMAARITDESYDELLKFIRPGIKEADIAEKMKEIFKEKGADEGFTMVCSGPNSSYPHYNDDQRVIQEKDIIILDWGCKYKNMCADMSRTIFVGGITEEERKVYEIVRASQEAGEKAAVKGAYIPDVDKASRDIIQKSGYGRYFFTRLGHGIGYSVHEAPDIKAGNERNLEKGMVFSIEPGIYIAGKFGMRIENIVAVTEDGNEVLNKATKEIMIV
ncbi:MAG TPA: Xaa-Pro peptidase family protein, partial [Sedimentibacter sp.]|nr:aminopeptidase P family protein [Sedimentibacter sp.]HNZ82456.1 Xaa-Pro peptidase family protein [Sedimentibacter sp.]HOH69651.1 Xaa-Pro peptidase family protein [Sedimentibacter sp.]HQB63201.1 Xaa-Pro peptidase family protein [Sedimentibacter sp.]